MYVNGGLANSPKSVPLPVDEIVMNSILLVEALPLYPAANNQRVLFEHIPHALLFTFNSPNLTALPFDDIVIN